MKSSTVLVLGANGRFGAAAVAAFCAAGWNVIAQTRRAPGAHWPAGVRGITLPMDEAAAIAAAAKEASVVVHAVNPLYTDWDRDMLPLARQGMDIAQRLGATFMLPGNVYNYGHSLPPRLTEETPQPDTLEGNTSKGLLRRRLEQEMRQRTAQGLNSIVIRAGDFFGAGSGSWLDQLIVKDIAKGKLAYPGPLNLPHAWAYLPDLARAFVALAPVPVNATNMAGEAASFQQFNFAGHTLTGRELLDHLDAAASDLDLRPAQGFKIGGMPWGLIRAVGLVYPMWRELARMSYLWMRPHALDGSELRRRIGPMPGTEIRAALRDSLIALGSGQKDPGKKDSSTLVRN